MAFFCFLFLTHIMLPFMHVVLTSTVGICFTKNYRKKKKTLAVEFLINIHNRNAFTYVMPYLFFNNKNKL